MDRYFEAKLRLFDTLMLPDGRAILNAEDDRTPALAAASRAPVWTYALDRPADFQAEHISLSLEATRFRLRSPQGTFPVETPLLGRFNVQNLLAAFAASMALDLDPADVLKGLTSIAGVPGRLERVHAGQPFTVVVDYAHTDDALKKVLETVRQLKPKRLITVFGCGGDRDRSKRPLMGAVASRLSDVVIVTSDNPRSEDPRAIIEEIVAGAAGRLGVEPDRRRAIELALDTARPGDVVVIAGKGHEQGQEFADRKQPFDDREVARALLRSAKVQA
jgi:UDP-N-acetylmuramoyl-L-alanyl-D-glutamate--2,6-diaminopimelate ligase